MNKEPKSGEDDDSLLEVIESSEDVEKPTHPHLHLEKFENEKRCHCILRHLVGCFLIPPLLIFHFLCFLVTFSMGIGVGILASVLHQICWDQKFYAFWQTYVTLVTIFVVIEIFFRFGFDTTLTNWMDRLQSRHHIELYYIPRGLYLLGYMGAVCLLFYAYQGAHREIEGVNLNATNVSRSSFDGEGDVTDPWKTNPLSLSPSGDHFHYSMIFFISLSYMIYVLTKENDWITHRRTVRESGMADPVIRGGVGNFVLFLGAHIIITFIYGLPLVGCVFLARQFLFGAEMAFGFGILMAILVGLAALFIERRHPFPTKPMRAPAYAYENHLRIRMGLFQLCILPFAAGRYFDANRSIALDAQNDDLLIFTVEVGVGVVSAIKIFGNDIFLLKEIYCPTKTVAIQVEYLNNEGSIVSVVESTQTIYLEENEEIIISPSIREPEGEQDLQMDPPNKEGKQDLQMDPPSKEGKQDLQMTPPNKEEKGNISQSTHNSIRPTSIYAEKPEIKGYPQEILSQKAKMNPYPAQIINEEPKAQPFRPSSPDTDDEEPKGQPFRPSSPETDDEEPKVLLFRPSSSDTDDEVSKFRRIDTPVPELENEEPQVHPVGMPVLELFDHNLEDLPQDSESVIEPTLADEESHSSIMIEPDPSSPSMTSHPSSTDSFNPSSTDLDFYN